jgi:integrase
MTWERVDLENGIIDLNSPHPRASRRKSRAVVPIPDAVCDLLKQRWFALGGKEPTTRTAAPLSKYPVVNLTRNSLFHRFHVARKRAGIGEGVTPFTLRHTAATMMIRSAPLIFASRMLGHRSVNITEKVYVHLTAEDLRPAAAALDALFV